MKKRKEGLSELWARVRKIEETVNALQRGISPGPPVEVRPALKWLAEAIGDDGVHVLTAGVIMIGGERKFAWTCRYPYKGTDLARFGLECDEKMASAFAPFSNRNRVAILRSLLSAGPRGPKTSRQLTTDTGLRGGPLYHHLKELILAGYVESRGRNSYQLTDRGLSYYLSALGLTRATIEATRSKAGVGSDKAATTAGGQK